MDAVDHRPLTLTSHRCERLLRPPDGLTQFQNQSQRRRTRVSVLHLAREAQSAFDWLDDFWLHLHAGIEPANLIVENLADECGMTKDAAGHGHWDGRG